LRAFNKRGVFDKDVNSVRIKTALHVEYAKRWAGLHTVARPCVPRSSLFLRLVCRADEKILRATVLMEMLEEYKWKR
jgi:hypothetical protein